MHALGAIAGEVVAAGELGAAGFWGEGVVDVGDGEFGIGGERADGAEGDGAVG